MFVVLHFPFSISACLGSASIGDLTTVISVKFTIWVNRALQAPGAKDKNPVGITAPGHLNNKLHRTTTSKLFFNLCKLCAVWYDIIKAQTVTLPWKN